MDDIDYFRRREAEERNRAAETPLDCARRIHEHLANAYARRATEPRTARLVLVDDLLRE